MNQYDPQPELELESDHPTSSLITFAIDNYGWEISTTHLGSGHPPLLRHPDFGGDAAMWKQCDYGTLNICHPHWFKKRLLEQIKQKADTMQQTGQGWAEPPEIQPLPLPDIHKDVKATAKQLEEDKTLRRIQSEVYDWAMQFGENESHDPRYRRICTGCDGAGEIKSPKQPTNPRTAWDEKVEYIYGPCSECKGVGSAPTQLKSLPPLLGMMEELGEITAPVLKRHQGRGFMDENEYHTAVYDGLADLMIFMCDFANREGIDLTEALNKTWDKVQNRNQSTWQADKDKEQSVEQVLQDKADLMDEDPSGYLKPNAGTMTDSRLRKLVNEALAQSNHRETDWLIHGGGRDYKCYLYRFDIGCYPESPTYTDRNIEYQGRLLYLPDYIPKLYLADKDKEAKPSRPLEEILKDPLVITEPVKSNKKPFMDDFKMDEATEDFHRSQESEEFKESVGMYVDDGLQPTDEDMIDRLIETIDCSDLWEEPQYRKRLYKSVAAIGLQYGDQNLTNIEEGLLKRLMLIAEDAEARLHGRDAREIRKKLNDLRKLRPDLLGEQQSTLEKKTKIDYGTDNA